MVSDSVLPVAKVASDDVSSLSVPHVASDTSVVPTFTPAQYRQILDLLHQPSVNLAGSLQWTDQGDW
ncbi:hypothetical protein HRI_002400700 [Hibiscus trionum]|uniref:Uncharacterized protein n=1 Tax=Hibiscus trionum TaxID=183268 RepID=A0A9W7HZB7_HIBTR|nr:hypothetical protein HRI_002400700 [Hibiscus trionum]